VATKSKPVTALGVRKTPAGWQVVEFQIQDGKVIAEKASEPDLRAMALERLRRDMSMFWGEV